MSILPPRRTRPVIDARTHPPVITDAPAPAAAVAVRPSAEPAVRIRPVRTRAAVRYARPASAPARGRVLYARGRVLYAVPSTRRRRLVRAAAVLWLASCLAVGARAVMLAALPTAAGLSTAAGVLVLVLVLVLAAGRARRHCPGCPGVK